jgi:DNA gyrase subunit B
MAKKVEEQYNAENIEVLEGLDPVRLRPTMYVMGSLDSKSLQHLIIECVNNSTDEFLAGYGKKITITLQSDGGIKVADEGRGIPVDLHPIHKKSALELVMTTLHAGGKFDKDNYKISSGINGVGISVCCGLSKYLEARVCRDGFEWLQKYEKGKPTTGVEKVKKSNKTGTSILFYPDDSILHDVNVKTETLAHKMMELSFLCPGLTIEIFDERDGESYSYFSKEGIQSLVQFLNEDKDSLFPNKPIFFNGTIDDVGVEIAFQYADQSRDFILSYCNTVSTTDAGRHERGFKSGLTRVINTFARNQKLLKDKDSNLEGDDIRDGLTAVVSVQLRQPLFEGQSKSKLGNEEVEPAVSQLITEKLTAYLDQDPSLGKRIVERALTAQRARAAAKSASEAIKKKSGSFGMASKLAKCRSKNAEECELFLVEGDSAAGPAKRTRDSRTQAILPLRGKVINALKCRLDELLKNNEIQTLIYALGTGIANTNLNGDEEDSLFDITKINYHKLILAADSDADGNHIQSLLLTFLFTYLRPLVEAGYVYIAKAPLFKVTVGSGKSKAKYYALDEKELEILNKKYPSGKVTRFKGLGEMDDDELAETTINPKTRTIVQVEIDSLGAASKMFSDLMGKSAAPRKEYLAKHASKHFKRIFESEAF